MVKTSQKMGSAQKSQVASSWDDVWLNFWNLEKPNRNTWVAAFLKY